MRSRFWLATVGVAGLAALRILAAAQEPKTLGESPFSPTPLPGHGQPVDGVRGAGRTTDGRLALVPEEGVLLLGNGEVIEGKISRVGDVYRVTLPGGEIRVKAADVDFCCGSLDEAYQRKRAEIGDPTEGWAGDVRAHLQLAQWCLQQGLLGPAGRELADARKADSRHPMISVLERRLKAAVEPPLQHPAPTSAGQYPSLDELDRLVRGMPPGAVETFTQTIQPLLVNYCGAAGCHGPQSPSRFRLLRIPPSGLASRRLTQRNLQAVLAWVNREAPAASPLLTAPIQPHGTVAKAVFSEAQAGQWKRIVDWVHLLAKRPAAEVPDESLRQSECGRQNAELPNLKSEIRHRKPQMRKEESPARGMPVGSPEPDSAPRKAPKTSSSPPPDRRPGAGAGSARQKSGASGSAVKRGAPLPGFVPIDPFDPEIFNRRYFAQPAPQPPHYPSN